MSVGSWRGWAALGAAILGITWSPIFIRWADVTGPSSALYRVLIAMVVLVPWRAVALLRDPNAARGLHRRAVAIALAGGAFFGMDLALYNTAVMTTTVTAATLLGNSSPIFVGIGSWLFFRRAPGRLFWAGLALALAGAAVVMAASLREAGAGRGSLAGDLLALVASIFFAAYMLATERVRAEMDTLTFSTIAVVGSVITLLVVCAVVDAPLSGFSARTWLALLGLGLISQLAAYLALVHALGQLPATVTSVGLLAQVPLTALLAVPLVGEPLTTLQLAGGALVLAGIYIVNSRSPGV